MNSTKKTVILYHVHHFTFETTTTIKTTTYLPNHPKSQGLLCSAPRKTFQHSTDSANRSVMPTTVLVQLFHHPTWGPIYTNSEIWNYIEFAITYPEFQSNVFPRRRHFVKPIPDYLKDAYYIPATHWDLYKDYYKIPFPYPSGESKLCYHAVADWRNGHNTPPGKEEGYGPYTFPVHHPPYDVIRYTKRHQHMPLPPSYTRIATNQPHRIPLTFSHNS